MGLLLVLCGPRRRSGRFVARHSRAAGLAAVVVAAVAGLTGCGASASSSTTRTVSRRSVRPVASRRPAQPSLVRLGCHQYCLDAGGYGDGGPVVPKMARVTTSRAAVGPDGTVAIEVRCLSRVACVGALAIAAGGSSGLEFACQMPAVPHAQTDWWAQSDLDLPAHATRTFGLTLSPCVRRLLAARRRLPSLVVADTGEALSALPVDQRAQLDPVDFETVALVAP